MLKKALSLGGLALLALTSAQASADGIVTQTNNQYSVVVQVNLQCTGTGASDVVSRHHTIKNTESHAIPKGYRVYWKASNGGTGYVNLAADLAPGATIDVGEPGQTNGYTCTAHFLGGTPDYAVKSVKWTSPTTASVDIQNVNWWVDAPASVARVQSFRCGVSAQVASADANVPAIPKGQTKTVTVSVPQANADYLLATANATNSVSEVFKANNVNKSVEFYNNKSCTPQ